MNCEDIKELLLNYINNESDANQRQDIDNHLLVCPTCKGEIEALAATESKLRQAYGEVAAGVSPSPGILNAIRQEVVRRERSRSTVRGWIGMKLRQVFGRLAWRRPVWQKATAGTFVTAMLCLMVILLNRAPNSGTLSNTDDLHYTLNFSPTSGWTEGQQAAIDIALNHPSVQAMLDGEGIVYEVIPVDGNGATEKYQVGIVDVDEIDSKSANMAGSESDTRAFYSMDAVDVPDGVIWGTSNNAIVDIAAESVLQLHSIPVESDSGSDWLNTEQIEEAATIVGSFDNYRAVTFIWGSLSYSSEAEVLVENVTQLSAYDSYSNTFSDEMEVWVRLTIDDQPYFAQVDLEEDSVVKLIEGGE